MKGKIEDMNEHYALVKLPDGRTANIKIENLPENSAKGHDIEIKGHVPQIIE